MNAFEYQSAIDAIQQEIYIVVLDQEIIRNFRMCFDHGRPIKYGHSLLTSENFAQGGNRSRMIYLREQSEKKKQNTRIPDGSGIFLSCYSTPYVYHREMNTFLIILTVALIIWIAGTYIVIQGIEGPVYKREVARDTYEIREYESYIVAEVVVEGDMKTALTAGFRQLAGYIFGGNTSQASIKMTVPVMDATDSSESIAMTAPVMESGTKNGKHTIAFTMPSSYTLETLPKPNNANIRFRKIEKSRKAVLRYTWYATEGRVEAKKKILKDLLNRDGYVMKGEMISAQYNPPMSFPPLRRNEILVDIE